MLVKSFKTHAGALDTQTPALLSKTRKLPFTQPAKEIVMLVK